MKLILLITMGIVVSMGAASILLKPSRFPGILNPIKFWIPDGDCPLAGDGIPRHFCPTPDDNGDFVCIDDYQFCDGVKDCPGLEDESPQSCFFDKKYDSQKEGRDAKGNSGGEVQPILEDGKPLGHRQVGKFIGV